MVEKEPGWLKKIVGTLFNPGGDPDAIRRAEGSVLELSRSVGSAVDELKPVGARLGETYLWPRIAAVNPQLANPSSINPGDVIHLPALQPAHA